MLASAGDEVLYLMSNCQRWSTSGRSLQCHKCFLDSAFLVNHISDEESRRRHVTLGACAWLFISGNRR